MKYRIFRGVPDIEQFTPLKPRLVILDDLMREADKNVVDLFTKGSHHFNISVMFVTQNIFNQGIGKRDISLNAHYIVCFKNPRDRQQILTLARQVYPEKSTFYSRCIYRRNESTIRVFASGLETGNTRQSSLPSSYF